MESARPLPFKSAYERYVDTMAEITSLNIQLAMLETCSFTKLGEFARPFSVKFGPRGASAAPVARVAPRNVSIDHLYDENGVNVYERFLRSHMRLVALTKLAFGPCSVESIAAELALAESYMRAGLWKQCHDHVSTAEEMLNEDKGGSTRSPAGSPLKSPKSPIRPTPAAHATRTGDAQIHHARALFAKLSGKSSCLNDVGLCSRHDVVAAFRASEFFSLVQATKSSTATTSGFAALCDAHQADETLDAIDVGATGLVRWDQLVRYLHAQDKSFQMYLQHLERTIESDVMAALTSAFRDVQQQLAGDATSNPNLVSSSSVSSVLLAHGCVNVQRIGQYIKSPPTSNGSLQITWPELVEAASRVTTDIVRAGMQCKVALLHGRYHMKRGQVDDAIHWLRRAVAGQLVMVGHDSHDMVDYLVAMADALCLKHSQALQATKDAVDQGFDKWLASEVGAAACRSEALRILEEIQQHHKSKSMTGSRKGAKLPSKKEVEAMARQNLRDQHIKTHGPAPGSQNGTTSLYLDEATDLYMQVWALEEQHFGRQDANTAIAYAGLGNVYILRNEPDEAVGYYTKAIETFEAACDGGVPASAFLRMHLAKVYMHLQRNTDAMTLLHDAATFFKSHAAQFLDSETTRRDAAANAIDAWRGWLQLANSDTNTATPQIYRNMVEAAEIGYGEFSLETADAMVAQGRYLLSGVPHANAEDGEEALAAASYIMEIHYGVHDKRVRKLRQEVVSVGAQRRHGDQPTKSPPVPITS
ncbi:hypothetical protein H310_00670 [Aphanomyces invadans]|uniref:Uncharacterized protein n=1 Tax=Aphanomyces invadans TaxID=157072 RepID=A0A024UWN3_9STRA|nr:hypothetical protein H310_00670 [Aphanomyces invadans]ETW10347.1 hypothetical protein H310_00670 [Aphanomyces invadans]|eukprot:XP_008861758.1 hypothetical protein H310_00670 [Aphanomyces invadans]